MSAFLDECSAVLSRTPDVLAHMLRDLPIEWTSADEGEGTWSPYVVVGHLIHGEGADWIPRLEIILRFGTSRPFEPFDREAQFRESAGKPLTTLLEEFSSMRQKSLEKLKELDLSEEQLKMEGLHPTLGVVTVKQLIATWTAHDLAHILQISRTMARRLKKETGPWADFLSVMK